ncbi:MAG: ATP-binding protein [Bacteroidota bacterium]
MKSIAYHILDIAQNAIQAGGTQVQICIEETDSTGRLQMTITDNGKGMTKEQAENASDPYFTSRNTRKVGLGLPLLRQNAERTGGNFKIESELGKGTSVKATFIKDNIDCPSKGDIVGTIHQLVTSNSAIDFDFCYRKNENKFELNTQEIKEVLDGTPLYQKEISGYIREMIEENMKDIEATDNFSYKT